MIKKIFLFFKNIFIKENRIKEIKASTELLPEKISNSFINSLKSDVVKEKKNKVETLTCVGDGLGIQNKMNF